MSLNFLCHGMEVDTSISSAIGLSIFITPIRHNTIIKSVSINRVRHKLVA